MPWDDAPDAGEGHNSSQGGIAVERLESIVSRYERLEEEVKALRGDQKDIMTEAKSAGFEPKILRHIIRIRATDPKELQEIESLTDIYRRALGC